MDSNYSYHNIFGKLEYENYFGALKTDFTMLKPGLLHKAMVDILYFKLMIFYQIVCVMKH